MSTHYRRRDPPPQQWPSPPPENVRESCYVREDAGRESLIVYDREDSLAWIQSTAWIALTDVL